MDIEAAEAARLAARGFLSDGEAQCFQSYAPPEFGPLLEHPSAKGRATPFRGLRRAAMPKELPPVMSEALENALVHGTVKNFPADIRLLHAGERGVAGSVMRDLTLGWLDSDVGKAWQAHRRHLFGADDPVPLVEPDKPPEAPAKRAKRKRA